MTIRLNEETERLIQEKVKAGVYESPEMMIRAGIYRLLQEDDFAPGELERPLQSGTRSTRSR
jgi:Arc/MetJ-type ribon-helix-helix transcriptional regulator